MRRMFCFEDGSVTALAGFGEAALGLNWTFTGWKASSPQAAPEYAIQSHITFTFATPSPFPPSISYATRSPRQNSAGTAIFRFLHFHVCPGRSIMGQTTENEVNVVLM